MLNPDSIRPDDRVLVLGMPDTTLLSSVAARLERGILVIMPPPNQLHEGRRALRDFDNVMLVPLDGAFLPWRDGFFTVIADVLADWPDAEAIAREKERVLSVTG